MTGPRGGTIWDAPVTLYVSGRGWVTGWSEVSYEVGGIIKKTYERPATNEEVFTAQCLPKN